MKHNCSKVKRLTVQLEFDNAKVPEKSSQVVPWATARTEMRHLIIEESKKKLKKIFTCCLLPCNYLLRYHYNHLPF